MDVDDVDVDDLTIESGVGDEKDVSEVPSLQVSSNLSRPMLLVLYLLNLWAVVFNIPNSALGVLLMILSTTVFSGSFISLHTFKTVLGLGRQDSDVIVFAFCSKCHSIHQLSSCVRQRNGKTVPRLCENRPWPNHPQVSKKVSCDGSLVRINAKGEILPLVSFPMTSLITRLRQLCLRPDFEHQITHWRDLPSVTGQYVDVYDGAVWKKFHVVDNVPFLSAPDMLALGLMLLLDWFQPYERTQYSCGCVFIALLNLPRATRFLPENLIFVCCFPGGKESEHDVVKLLTPLVDELVLLWTGIQVKTVLHPRGILLRAALLIVSADLPAGRPLCGFQSFNVMCSKCYHSDGWTAFYTENQEKLRAANRPQGPPRKMCSGYDCEKWERRCGKEQLERGQETLRAKSPTELQALQSEYRAKFSVLSRLPYFDPVVMLVIEPMHCLLLGLIKSVIRLLMDTQHITDAMLHSMEERMKTVKIPREHSGRFRGKIGSRFSGFTADEYKTFALSFSCWLFAEHLPDDVYAMWCSLVEAVELWYTASVSERNLSRGLHAYIAFEAAFEALFTTKAVTFNQHNAFHFPDDVRNFGSPYGYHSFFLERALGRLGRIPNDCRHPQERFLRTWTEKQAMLEYQDRQAVLSLSDEERKLVQKVLDRKCGQRSQYSEYRLDVAGMLLWQTYAFQPCSVLTGSECFHGRLLNPTSTSCGFSLRDVVLRYLQEYAYRLYSHDVRVSYHIPKFRRLNLFGYHFDSELWGSGANSLVMVLWQRGDVDQCWFVGYVEYYFSTEVSMHGSVGVPHYFAKVRWCQDNSAPTERICKRIFSFTGAESKDLIHDIVPGRW